MPRPVYLHRTSRREAGRCQGCGCSRHSAKVEFGEAESFGSMPPKPPNDDPRWPTQCDRCPYLFTPEDGRRVSL